MDIVIFKTEESYHTVFINKNLQPQQGQRLVKVNIKENMVKSMQIGE